MIMKIFLRKPTDLVFIQFSFSHNPFTAQLFGTMFKSTSFAIQIQTLCQVSYGITKADQQIINWIEVPGHKVLDSRIVAGKQLDGAQW